MFRLLTAAAAVASFVSAGPISKREWNGPVLPDNLPDPSLIQVGDTWYAFTTGPGPLGNLAPAIPYATSTDFNTWTFNGGNQVLSRLGNWANPSAVWAPDVLQLPNGTFVMYYTAEGKGPAGDSRVYHCVGAATSDNVAGPYEPVDNALACPISQGGAIDPSGFVDSDGTIYVVYKVDGNNIGSGGNCNNGNGKVPTPIMLQKLMADGITLDGPPTTILDHDSADGPLVEAPSIVKKDNSYFLFFSSNCYSGPDYDTSYAVSTNGITNGGKQYAKAQAPNAPLLKTGTGSLYAPGGLTIAKDGVHVVFHADKGTTADTRQLYVGTVNLDTTKNIVTI